MIETSWKVLIPLVGEYFAMISELWEWVDSGKPRDETFKRRVEETTGCLLMMNDLYLIPEILPLFEELEALYPTAP